MIVVNYVYDAWGNHKVFDTNGVEIEDKGHIGYLNPFRYRSYYYDADFGFYYLKTRYYDPKVGRFINMDDTDFLAPDVINGLNLYAYCGNNPVMNVDPNGNFFFSLLVGLAVGAIVGFGGTIVADYVDDGEIFNGSISLESYVANIAVGAVAGAVVATISPAIVSGISSIASSAGSAIAISGGAVAVNTTAVAVTGTLGVLGASILFAQTPKKNGYYGERWPSDPHKPDHVHLRGNKTDIRIGRDGKPLKGERPLNAQERKALRQLWSDFLKLFGR